MSKFARIPVLTQITRKFHTTKILRDAPLDPVKPVDNFIEEKHIKPLIPLMYFLTFIAIPAGSVYMWYKEYLHHVVHRDRVPWPKHDFLNAQAKPFPWGDGEKSAMFHPYYNFTPKGYITDKQGNPLPKGVYSEV